MKELIVIDKKNYDAMYQTVMREVMKKYLYSRKLYIDMTKEEYAEYMALSYCMKLRELTGRVSENNE